MTAEAPSTRTNKQQEVPKEREKIPNQREREKEREKERDRGRSETVTTSNHNRTLQEPTTRKFRSGRATVEQEVVTPKSFTPEDVRETVRLNVPDIFNIDTIEHCKDTYVELLVGLRMRYRTTTKTTAMFQNVFLDLNGALHVEEGVHYPSWQEGSGSDIVEMLFSSDTHIHKVWGVAVVRKSHKIISPLTIQFLILNRFLMLFFRYS